ncbi:MAG: hypothetical protein EOM03_05170 [Clostridia bacterium]|nr:hypothetical protein [Clostridia bacterium]NCC83501.1 hypothetical protein [Clostridia bacterium]
MAAKQPSLTTMDEYIERYSGDVRERLKALRAVIRESAPLASEKISYQMPTFYLEGNLVHFAAFDHHIGFYPAPSGIERFKADLAPYKWAKGSVQFPHNQPLPLDLVRQIVTFRVEENLAQAATKKSKRRQ